MRIPTVPRGLLAAGNPRNIALAAGVALIGMATCAARARDDPRPTSQTPPNVVLIVADDLGWSDLGVHAGRIATPNIDRLFREGVELRRFYTSPLCTPTRAALLTGRDPIRMGLQYWVLRGWSTNGLRGSETTLAERLRAAGYQTAAVGKWHLGHARREYHPNAHGFDSFYGQLLGGHYDEHTYEGGKDFQRDGKSVSDAGYSTRLFGAEVERVIEQRDPERPFFIYAPFQAPHAPLMAPESLVSAQSHIASGNEKVYAAMVVSLDQEVGRILLALDRANLARNTIVWFSSDNGAANHEPGSNAPFRGGKGSVFEGGIRVAAAIRWPGVLPAGAASEQRLRDFDVVPTLLEALALPIDGGPALDGSSVWAELVGGATRPRSPFYFAVNHRDERRRDRAVLDDPWKLVVSWSGNDESTRSVQLFDIRADPAESRDRSAEFPERVNELDARRQAWESTGAEVGYNPRPRRWQSPSDWTQLSRRRFRPARKPRRPVLPSPGEGG